MENMREKPQTFSKTAKGGKKPINENALMTQLESSTKKKERNGEESRSHPRKLR